MKRRNQFLTILGLAFLTASCSKNSTEIIPAQTKQTAPASKVALKSSPTKPFKGSMTLIPTAVSLNCNCTGGAFPIGTLTGSGNITHLGLTSTNIQPCVVPNAAGLYDVMSVCGSFVAANGDQLYTNTLPYTLAFGPTGMMEGNIQVNLVGGTGKFSTASGSFTATLSINPATFAATMNNIDGTITY